MQGLEALLALVALESLIVEWALVNDFTASEAKGVAAGQQDREIVVFVEGVGADIALEYHFLD